MVMSMDAGGDQTMGSPMNDSVLNVRHQESVDEELNEDEHSKASVQTVVASQQRQQQQQHIAARTTAAVQAQEAASGSSVVNIRSTTALVMSREPSLEEQRKPVMQAGYVSGPQGRRESEFKSEPLTTGERTTGQEHENVVPYMENISRGGQGAQAPTITGAAELATASARRPPTAATSDVPDREDSLVARMREIVGGSSATASGSGSQAHQCSHQQPKSSSGDSLNNQAENNSKASMDSAQQKRSRHSRSSHCARHHHHHHHHRSSISSASGVPAGAQATTGGHQHHRHSQLAPGAGHQHHHHTHRHLHHQHLQQQQQQQVPSACSAQKRPSFSHRPNVDTADNSAAEGGGGTEQGGNRKQAFASESKSSTSSVSSSVATGTGTAPLASNAAAALAQQDFSRNEEADMSGTSSRPKEDSNEAAEQCSIHQSSNGHHHHHHHHHHHLHQQMGQHPHHHHHHYHGSHMGRHHHHRNHKKRLVLDVEMAGQTTPGAVDGQQTRNASEQLELEETSMLTSPSDNQGGVEAEMSSSQGTTGGAGEGVPADCSSSSAGAQAPESGDAVPLGEQERRAQKEPLQDATSQTNLPASVEQANSSCCPFHERLGQHPHAHQHSHSHPHAHSHSHSHSHHHSHPHSHHHHHHHHHNHQHQEHQQQVQKRDGPGDEQAQPMGHRHHRHHHHHHHHHGHHHHQHSTKRSQNRAKTKSSSVNNFEIDDLAAREHDESNKDQDASSDVGLQKQEVSKEEEQLANLEPHTSVSGDWQHGGSVEEAESEENKMHLDDEHPVEADERNEASKVERQHRKSAASIRSGYHDTNKANDEIVTMDMSPNSETSKQIKMFDGGPEDEHQHIGLACEKQQQQPQAANDEPQLIASIEVMAQTKRPSVEQLPIIEQQDQREQKQQKQQKQEEEEQQQIQQPEERQQPTDSDVNPLGASGSSDATKPNSSYGFTRNQEGDSVEGNRAAKKQESDRGLVRQISSSRENSQREVGARRGSGRRGSNEDAIQPEGSSFFHPASSQPKQVVESSVPTADRRCRLCWCCCCPCSSLSNKSNPTKGEAKAISEPVASSSVSNKCQTYPNVPLEEIRLWGDSFDRLMKCPDGRKVFQDFLRCEYSEENILFWIACEDLKSEKDSKSVATKARDIYEDYISILSAKEVSLDSRVRDVINNNIKKPTSNIFDEAQLQIYTLMHRDSYPRFINSPMYKKLAQIQTTSRKSSS